ncbi:MAG: LemA family protein [Acidobacteriota bacterium]
MAILIFLIVLFVIVLIILIWGIAVFNSLVRLRNRFKNAFAQIDVQLKRRYNLIPNMVEVAKGYLKHERETLERVTQARNQALNASQQAAQDPANPDAIKGLIGAEGLLGGALGRLMVVVEQYPDLKANQNMMQLNEELASTENKIAFARQAYNDAVMTYNTRREVFPDQIVASMCHFKAAELFEVTTEEEREVPKVTFT